MVSQRNSLQWEHGIYVIGVAIWLLGILTKKQPQSHKYRVLPVKNSLAHH